MNDVNYLQLLRIAAPETIVVLAALVVLAVDLLTMRGLETRLRFVVGGMIACAGCAAAAAWMLLTPLPALAPDGMLAADAAVQFVQIALLGLTVLTISISIESDFTGHVGEYLALILLAAVGMMFLAASEDMLMVFISLELTSLSLYILAAFNKRSVASAEAALKYFLFGGMSAAFTLFGFSLIYGLSGATNLHAIAAVLGGKGLDPLLAVAIVMVVIGFGFKVAAAPFHLWAPDAYQGAPTPSAAFIASGSKLASFFIFAKFMAIAFAGVEGSAAFRHVAPGWVPVIGIVAALSMILGNLAAIVQSSLRRLLAYSAIAHAGYLLLAVMSHNPLSLASLMYYAVTYGLTLIGAFGVVAIVEKETGDVTLSGLAGLSRRAPVISLCMLVFMLSLAGIPPLAGFFAKFYVFAAALKSDAPGLGLLWLVILALGMSVVSLYYYLRVLKQIYVAEAPADATALRVPPFSQGVLCFVAILVTLFGCAPGLLLKPILDALMLSAQ
jgi:NADH-quinone oxidoreductase subunit N